MSRTCSTTNSRPVTIGFPLSIARCREAFWLFLPEISIEQWCDTRPAPTYNSGCPLGDGIHTLPLAPSSHVGEGGLYRLNANRAAYARTRHRALRWYSA